MTYPTTHETRPLATMPVTINIGTAPEASTAYTLYIQHEVTLRIEQVTFASDAEGLLIADVEEIQEFFRPGINYHAWLTQAGAGIMELEVFTVNDTPVDMLTLTFTDAEAIEQQTITLL